MIVLPSGIIVDKASIRFVVKSGLKEATLFLANCPPLPTTMDDYDYLRWLADEVSPVWKTKQVETKILAS